MARTYRNVPHEHVLRRPRYRHKLLEHGVKKKWIVTDYDDIHIAALREHPKNLNRQ